MSIGTTPKALVYVFSALIFMFAGTIVLTRSYNADRGTRAHRHFLRGQQLAQQGRNAQAVEEYRAALTYSKGNFDYRLALAGALMNLGDLREAETHLKELQEGDPTHAVVNLMLARVDAKEGKYDDAVSNYHKAIYSLWTKDPEQNRIQARFELVQLLEKRGENKEVLAELLHLSAEVADDPPVQQRIGEMLLKIGAPGNAGEVFQDIVKRHARDGEAYLGLAEAKFAVGDYQTAESAFRRAARFKPDDADIVKRLETTSQVLDLDPTLAKLTSAERLQRARELVRRALADLDQCLGESGKQLAEADAQLPDAARKLLASRLSRRRQDQTPIAISMAEQLWQARNTVCGSGGPPDEPLAIVLAKVAK